MIFSEFYLELHYLTNYQYVTISYSYLDYLQYKKIVIDGYVIDRFFFCFHCLPVVKS